MAVIEIQIEIVIEIDLSSYPELFKPNLLKKQKHTSRSSEVPVHRTLPEG